MRKILNHGFRTGNTAAAAVLQRRLRFGNHFADIGQRYGPFDWVTLDSGQYDPRWAHLHMNPEQAAQAANDLGTDALTPAHVGRFTLAPHDWHDPSSAWSKPVKTRATSCGHR